MERASKASESLILFSFDGRTLSAQPAENRKTQSKTRQMNTKKQWINSIVALTLFGAFGSVGASSAHAQATKRGWWIRVNGPKTEAALISFQIGTSKKDSRNWRTWKSGQRAEFDLPADFRDAAKLYIRATSTPRDKNAWFCVFYNNHGVEHFEFDGDEDHNMKQDD